MNINLVLLSAAYETVVDEALRDETVANEGEADEMEAYEMGACEMPANEIVVDIDFLRIVVVDNLAWVAVAIVDGMEVLDVAHQVNKVLDSVGTFRFPMVNDLKYSNIKKLIVYIII